MRTCVLNWYKLVQPKAKCRTESDVELFMNLTQYLSKFKRKLSYIKRKISKSHEHDDVEVDIILFLSFIVTFQKNLPINRKKKEK